MDILILHKQYDEAHLADVVARMRELGAPTIRAIRYEDDTWMALEGCHRIRAAKILGLTPKIEEVDADLDTDVTDPELGLDLDNPGTTLQDLLDEAHRRPMIRFEEE